MRNRSGQGHDRVTTYSHGPHYRLLVFELVPCLLLFVAQRTAAPFLLDGHRCQLGGAVICALHSSPYRESGKDLEATPETSHRFLPSRLDWRP
jgi:hypothetical protein